MANKRKRSSPRQLAHDWPPTSEKKKLLTRPRKLLRMDEGPYRYVWLRVLHDVIHEHQARWKKMSYFRRIHREIHWKVDLCVPGEIGLLCSGGGSKALIFWRRSRKCVHFPVQMHSLDLDWKVCTGSTGGQLEKLCWTVAQKSIVLSLVLTFGRRHVFHFKTIAGWKDRIGVEVTHFVHTHPDCGQKCAQNFMNAAQNDFGIVAPRELNREEAKKCFCATFITYLADRRALNP